MNAEISYEQRPFTCYLILVLIRYIVVVLHDRKYARR